VKGLSREQPLIVAVGGGGNRYVLAGKQQAKKSFMECYSSTSADSEESKRYFREAIERIHFLIALQNNVRK
jgi:hypothetical protein